MTLLFRGRSSNIPRYLPRTTRAASLLCILMRTAPLGPLRTDLGCRPRLDGARRFALGHAKLLSRASAQQRAGGLAQQRAATTQTPRRPIGAGGVRGASRSGSASVITTHALFARKVQRKLSNGVAGLPPADHLLIERDRGQFVPSRRRRMMANVRAESLL